MKTNWVAVALGCVAISSGAAASTFEEELTAIQQQWAATNYGTMDAAARKGAFEALRVQAHEVSTRNPQRAEALIWEGIVLSTYAGAKGGLGALGLAKQSRTVLEAAMKLDPGRPGGVGVYEPRGTLLQGTGLSDWLRRRRQGA